MLPSFSLLVAVKRWECPVWILFLFWHSTWGPMPRLVGWWGWSCHSKRSSTNQAMRNKRNMKIIGWPTPTLTLQTQFSHIQEPYRNTCLIIRRKKQTPWSNITAPIPIWLQSGSKKQSSFRNSSGVNIKQQVLTCSNTSSSTAWKIFLPLLFHLLL